MISICIAVAVFFITWNSKSFIDNNSLKLIGIAYLFIGILDFFHTMGFPGMMIFSDYPYYSNQLWIVARYFQSIALVLSFVLVRSKMQVKISFLIACCSVITVLGLLSVLVWHNFPICYIDGVGQTPFKIASEYIIIAVLAVSALLLRKNKELFEGKVYKYLFCSILLTIVSEWCFTAYISNSGFANMLGHCIKILSFYFVYKAIIETAIREPYDLIFREIKQAEQQLYKQNQTLSDQVISDSLTITAYIELLEQQHTALRESLEREAYLLHLSDMIRPLEKPDDILTAVCNLLADYLKTAQVNYFEWDIEQECAIMRMQVKRGIDAPNPPPRFELGQYPYMVSQLRSGQAFIVSDISESPLLGEAERQQYMDQRILSQLSMPIVRDGELVASLTVRQATPREWMHSEIALVKETAERTWEAFEKANARFMLQQSTIELRNIINSTEDFIWSVDADYKLLLSNSAIEEFVKAQYGTLFKAGMPFTAALPEEHAMVFLELFERVKQTGALQLDLRNTVQGDKVISYYLHPIYMNSELLEITVFGRDISDRIKAEQEIITMNTTLENRIAERTAELKQSMETLRNFSMTLTHDLKMPLYEIGKYANQIKEGTDIAANASRIIHKCVNLNIMVAELLEYEKTSAVTIRKETVDLREIVESVYEEYKTDHSVLDFQTGIPLVQADKKLIRHVVGNLISNSLKFSADKQTQKIIFGCKKEGAEYVFYVKDNGIGVDMRYADKLFNLFERQNRNIEGHGIGLASVRLIIERHGGRAWIDGKVNVGTTVYFTLPIEMNEVR